MLRGLLFSCFLLFPAFLNATSVFISGKAPGLTSKQVSVFTYDDHLTQAEKLLFRDSIKADESFEINVPLNQTTLLIIRAGNREVSLYAEPGGKYTLVIHPPETGSAPVVGKCIPVRVEITNTDSLELNKLIAKFNLLVDNFYFENPSLFMNRDFKVRKKKVDKFRDNTDSLFSYSNNSFFRTYMYYNFAPLYEAAMVGKKYLYKNYFSGPILYDNPEYFMFFRA